MENEMKTLSVSGDPSEKAELKLGTVPLAPKRKPNTECGTKTHIETNIRKLTIKPNTPIFKYDVQINFVYTKADGKEVSIEMSKSQKKGYEHENDKLRCQRVYKEVVSRYKELQRNGPYFYDRQASLYTLTKLKNENISFDVVEGISKRKNFIKAQFILKKVADSFQSTSDDISKTTNSAPAAADKTLLEAMNVIVSGPAFENENVITIGACVHYLIDPAGINVPYREYSEGSLYTSVGATKSVKTLEGTAKNAPSLFMTTEMKTTLFHPDYVPLIDLLRTYHGFKENLKPNAPVAIRIENAFIGLEVFPNYGPHEDLEEAAVLKIRGFHNSSRETFFEVELNGTKKKTNVLNYFKDKYEITLKFPDLFTIETKSKHGKMHIPAELLLLCPSQTVKNDQMINKEQADMIKMSAAQPHIRKSMTNNVARGVGLASNNIYGFIKVEEPIKIEGIVLPKPNIAFADGKFASLNNAKAKIPTDFQRAGKYYDAKQLSNWEIAFVLNEEVKGLADELVKEMRNNGMSVTNPHISFIVRDDLESIFKKAKDAKREIVFFVVKSRYNYHQRIKALEQKYDVLTQEVRAETAEKVRVQAQTRLNIINKTNIKLGGLNYEIHSKAFNNPNQLIIGFETSRKSGGNPNYPISVGYATNMLDHYQKFAGGYVYVKPGKDIYGPVITETLLKILQTAKKNSREIKEIVIYFNGITEGQFSLINEDYSKKIKEACKCFEKEIGVDQYRPHITIIASTKRHDGRFYKSDNKFIANLEPGTVIDHTIVSNVYCEWYHASSVARQGTGKTTKFTLIFTTKTGAHAEPMSQLEQLTNDLCYDHQIVFHPISLPAPLFIAGENSKRGGSILSEKKGPVFTNDELDLTATNEKYGCWGTHLFATRYTA